MKVMDILVKDAVILNLGVGTKREVLDEMATALAKVEPFASAPPWTRLPLAGRSPA